MFLTLLYLWHLTPSLTPPFYHGHVHGYITKIRHEQPTLSTSPDERDAPG